MIQEKAKQLAVACRKKGYINNENVSLAELLSDSPFEVLWIISNNQPIAGEEIKNKASSVSPVLISRTISKLEADNCITTDNMMKYIFTKDFSNLLIEDELKLQRMKEEEEKQKKEAEYKDHLNRVAEQLKVIANILIKDGFIKPDDMDVKTLMAIPDFEIISILNEEGSLTIEQLKLKTHSVSPVLISRTISKLEANNLIVRDSGDKLNLASGFKLRIEKGE